MPKEQIRHNDISERTVKDNEKLSPKELFQRAAGEGRTVESGEKKQLTSASGFTLFSIAVVITAFATAFTWLVLKIAQALGV